MDRPTDTELVRRIKNGDYAAFDLLVERYHGPVLGFLEAMVGDGAAAEDLFQETFLKFLRSLDRYRDRGRLRAWLFTLARNAAYDQLRKRTEVLHGDDALPAQPDPHTPETVALELERGEAVRRAVLELPNEQREVVLLRFYGELTFAQIAKLTGSPLGTALARCHYGLRKLRTRMNDTGQEERHAGHPVSSNRA